MKTKTKDFKDFKPMFIIEVSHRALLGRLDRALRKENQRIRADRRGGGVSFLLIDIKKAAVLAAEVDLEKLARQLEVLEPWERAARPTGPAKRGRKASLAQSASQ